MRYKPLLMRANRFMGSALTDSKLVTVEQLGKANERLLEVIQKGDLKKASILQLLIYELKLINESVVIDYQVEQEKIPLIELSHYGTEEILKQDLDLELCWTTRTLPFDHIEDFFYVATSYYMSVPVRRHWEQELGGNIIWYATSIESMTNMLLKLEESKGGKEGDSEEEEVV